MIKNQLRIGTKIEREHSSTIKFIKDYQKKYGKIPPENKIYKMIAQNHLSEDRLYYQKLQRCRL